MKVHEFQCELWLPQPRDRVFSFFSDPANLDDITPPWLSFKIVTPLPVSMKEGALIDYRLRVRGFPLRWRSKITRWNPPESFVDEQLVGPYRLWHHEHTFLPIGGGTLVRDQVRYATPLDALVHRFFVRPDIERIFEFRTQELRRHFSKL